MNVQKGAMELWKMWGAFRQSRVLLTANKLGMFDHLSSPRTAGELAAALGLDPRATEVVLDALTGLGLLKKRRGLLRKPLPTYRNTALAQTFLVKDGLYYQGDILRHADALWQSWSGLDEVLRTGSPATGFRDHRAFIRGMHNIAVLRVPQVMKVIDLKGVKRALDLGGGPGTYSAAMAKKGVSVTLYDMPETLQVAREMIAVSGAGGIDLVAGNFLTDDIGGGFDLILISQILHSFSAEDNIGILRKARGALNPGGRVAIQEFYIDRTRTSPPQGVLFSINMLVNTPAGRCYAPEEMKGWLTEAGFGGIRKHVMADHVIMTAKARG